MRGKPALGCAMTRARSCGASSPTSGANSVGPSEQLSPTAEAPSADSVVAAMAGVVPRKVRPSSPKVMVANTGSVVLSTAASTAALASSRSAMVSTTMRSQPAASAARACSEKMSKASSKVRVPKGSSSAPVGPMSPATSGAPAARALAAAAAYTSATVAPAFASFKRLVLNVLVVMQSAPASTY